MSQLDLDMQILHAKSITELTALIQMCALVIDQKIGDQAIARAGLNMVRAKNLARSAHES